MMLPKAIIQSPGPAAGQLEFPVGAPNCGPPQTAI